MRRDDEKSQLSRQLTEDVHAPFVFQLLPVHHDGLGLVWCYNRHLFQHRLNLEGRQSDTQTDEGLRTDMIPAHTAELILLPSKRKLGSNTMNSNLCLKKRQNKRTRDSHIKTTKGEERETRRSKGEGRLLPAKAIMPFMTSMNP